LSQHRIKDLESLNGWTWNAKINRNNQEHTPSDT